MVFWNGIPENTGGFALIFVIVLLVLFLRINTLSFNIHLCEHSETPRFVWVADVQGTFGSFLFRFGGRVESQM